MKINNHQELSKISKLCPFRINYKNDKNSAKNHQEYQELQQETQKLQEMIKCMEFL